MLRTKKFLDIKRRGIYKYLKLVNIDRDSSIIERKESILLDVYYISLYHNDEFDFEIVRSSTFSYNNLSLNYTIQNEKYTNTWLMVCKDIIVLYIDNNDIEKFYSSYNTSNDYKFRIYKYNLGYLAICVSHTFNQSDINLLLDYGKEKYIILSHFVKEDESTEIDEYNKKHMSFIVLNDNVQNKLEVDSKCHELYTFSSTIGLGTPNITILFFIDIFIKYTKNFKNYPINYMCV